MSEQPPSVQLPDDDAASPTQRLPGREILDNGFDDGRSYSTCARGGGDLEVVIEVNGEEEPAAYEGRPAYRNLAASQNPVAASEPAPEGGGEAPPPNTVDFSAEVLPNSATMMFSLVNRTSERLGCTIDPSSGSLTAGNQTGAVKGRVSDGSRNPGHADELTLTINARPTARPAEEPDGGADSAPEIDLPESRGQ
jgi:hypothetical protein